MFIICFLLVFSGLDAANAELCSVKIHVFRFFFSMACVPTVDQEFHLEVTKWLLQMLLRMWVRCFFFLETAVFLNM